MRPSPTEAPILSRCRHWPGFDHLDLDPDVTYVIGENGSAKSTLREALAVVSGFNPEGGSRNFHFATRGSHSQLANHLRLRYLSKD